MIVRRTVLQRLVARLTFMALILVFCSSCSDRSKPRETFEREILEDATERVDLHFHHFIGATGEFYMPEIMGSGVALFDYDNDGDLDVYLLQGAMINPDKEIEDSLFPPADGPITNRLFQNQLAETGQLRFEDVTRLSNLGDSRYGMGAAVGDYDNDGDIDLYVTNFGSNVLYRNNGDGSFSDVTDSAGVDDPRLSTGATFFDYDQDHDLDLFVLSYVDFTVEGNKDCWDVVGTRDYCLPAQYNPLPDRIFRNEGNGHFQDVTQASGVGKATGAGLGITISDFNSDGWLDVYIANDGTPNHLWINQRDGTFIEEALLAGVAYNAEAMIEAGMGVGAGDFDNDGDEDIFVTNLTAETNTLYQNDGSGNFEDVTTRFQLSSLSFPYTGFGADWLDYDNDGDLDLFIVNGAVGIIEALRGQPYPYNQKNQLLRNDGKGLFTEVTERAGPALQRSEVSRGAAFGDLDNDGDIDVVVSNNNGPARVLLNQVGNKNNWLQVRLERDSKPVSGSQVIALFKERGPQFRRVRTDGSYLSVNDSRVHFGLDNLSRIQGIIVAWHGGTREHWSVSEINRSITLVEGTGKIWRDNPIKWGNSQVETR